MLTRPLFLFLNTTGHGSLTEKIDLVNSINLKLNGKIAYGVCKKPTTWRNGLKHNIILLYSSVALIARHRRLQAHRPSAHLSYFSCRLCSIEINPSQCYVFRISPFVVQEAR